MNNRFIRFAAAPVLVGAILFGACGTASPTPDGGAAVSSGGVIDPDARLAFDGKVYRLTGLEQANLTDGAKFFDRGAADSVNIETGGRVFSREGDDGALYTFSDGDEDVPGFWLRWTPIDG